MWKILFELNKKFNEIELQKKMLWSRQLKLPWKYSNRFFFCSFHVKSNGFSFTLFMYLS